ncbi:f-box domain-containing protein [Zymoseptoria brevis]|uniref:F-box domain-containing protein n=1 Tax=Zymoseptoria brevis TaxID=1047168 RepID=A0A0F4G6X0_9PEZI|nr:f-box domain-containing protein [Zymoseptoria brevis]
MENTKEERRLSDAAPETEAELEAFRQQWRQEVLARNKKSGESSAKAQDAGSNTKTRQESSRLNVIGASTARRREDYSEAIEPRTYHDLPDKEEQLKLGIEGQDHDRNVNKEPSNALEHYERAVEKETQGNLGESMRHYRKAFKLDDGVHEAYKKKHFPPSSFVKTKPTNVNPWNAASTVPGTAHHSLHGSAGTDALPTTLKQLVEEFSTIRIEPPEPPTSASPPQRCLIAELPEEILAHILSSVATTDVASFVRLAQVCKRLAYLILAEEPIWKEVVEGKAFGFAAMHYDFACEVSGQPIELQHYFPLVSQDDEQGLDVSISTPEERQLAFHSLTSSLLQTTYAASYLRMFRSRPRVRFNGCYISTVNYTRAGANSSNTLTWGAPVHVVTYFRYLRFFRDGAAISLLTTAEPADVVHHLTKSNLGAHSHTSALPSSVMKDALRGRWRLSGPLSSQSSGPSSPLVDLEQGEMEGDVFVETEGVVSKYTYVLHLALAHAGKGARNNKLAWKGFWSWDKEREDFGRFELRNDKAFYWSRVKSYGLGWE